MPYIDQGVKREIDAGERVPETAGELTYTITKQLIEFIQLKGLKYQTLAEVMGALDGAKIDLQLRILEPYERLACSRNGDVWPEGLIP